MFNRSSIFVGVVVGSLILIGIVLLTQNKVATVSISPVVKPTATPAAATDQVQSASLRDVMIELADDDPYYGPEDAPVIMIEFSDYLCPWCGKFYFETLPQILAAYPDQVRYVHRDYPVLGTFDEDAPMRAAVAAGCALAQGQFWEMHTKLFEPYQDMDMSTHMAGGNSGSPPDPAEREAMSQPYTAEGLRASAEAVGLDMDAYDRCVATQDPAQEIQNDLQYGMLLNISSVPTYVINGMLVPGSQSFDLFSQVIDKALAEYPLN